MTEQGTTAPSLKNALRVGRKLVTRATDPSKTPTQNRNRTCSPARADQACSENGEQQTIGNER